MTPPRSPLPELPARIGELAAIATNLSWSWSRDARLLFCSIDPVLWHQTRHNPIAVLEQAPAERLVACAADPVFLRRYDAVREQARRGAEAAGSWFASAAGERAPSTIAYFCAEFGLHASVPIYAGGLGVLAGDHCKAASDLGVPLVGVGLLYTRAISTRSWAPTDGSRAPPNRSTRPSRRSHACSTPGAAAIWPPSRSPAAR